MGPFRLFCLVAAGVCCLGFWWTGTRLDVGRLDSFGKQACTTMLKSKEWIRVTIFFERSLDRFNSSFGSIVRQVQAPAFGLFLHPAQVYIRFNLTVGLFRRPVQFFAGFNLPSGTGLHSVQSDARFIFLSGRSLHSVQSEIQFNPSHGSIHRSVGSIRRVVRVYIRFNLMFGLIRRPVQCAVQFNATVRSNSPFDLIRPSV